MRILILSISILLLLSACQEEKVAKPRPRQYPRIHYPDKEISTQSPESCPFTIALPVYASVVKKEKVHGETTEHSCWMDIKIAPFGATIHCSYYPINQENTLEQLVEDAFTLASKHNVKASFREEYAIETEEGSKGLLFKIDGPVATPYQFYLSDEESHFFRGSLYFDHKIELDSMAPIIGYLQEDINEMVGSIKWK